MEPQSFPANHPPVYAPPIYVAGDALASPRLPLLEALNVALDAGADGFEIPQELLPLAMNPDELPPLQELLARFAAPPVLTMREPLFQRGQAQTQLLEPALLQAQSYGCGVVVWPLGELHMADGSLDDALRGLGKALATLGQRAPGVRFLVANDATPSQTHLATWNTLFERTATWPQPLGMSFDVAHWTCTGEDAVEAAQMLGRFVQFVRVAGAIFQDGRCVVQPVRPSETVFPALRSLPPTAPRAVAFPLTAPDRALLTVMLREELARLRSGLFTL